ncbi:hypothetical protein Trydic_g21772 [Trypoxylus dichotomus]
MSDTNGKDPEFTLDDELNLFCQQVDSEQSRRDKELFDFLEELINSKEFRQVPSKKNAATQVLPRYLDKYAKETKELIQALAVDFSLVTYFRKRRDEDKMLRIRELCEENRKVRACQRDAIGIIKEHIDRAAQLHASRIKTKVETRLGKIENLLKNINVQPAFKHKIIEQVISIKKLRRNQVIGRKQRELAIVKKLLNEKKRWRQIQAIQNKTYDYKIKRRPPKKESAESLKESLTSNATTNEGIETHEDISSEPVLRESIKEEPELKLEPIQEIIEYATKGNNGKRKDKGEKSKEKKRGKTVKPQKDKMPKDKPNKKEKDAKKKNKKQDIVSFHRNSSSNYHLIHFLGFQHQVSELIVPEVPVINPRRKVRAEGCALMDEIVRQHEELLMVVDERRCLEELLADEKLSYEKDDSCYWRPNPIVFEEFFNGEIYKKRVTIINGGRMPKKIRLYAAVIDDGFDPNLIEVDNFGLSFLVPGFSLKLTVTFRPRKLTTVTHGKLTFISCANGTDNYKQFSIAIKCIPYIEQVHIIPNHLKFGTVRYWQVKDLKPKRLRVISTNLKTYRVSIKKILENSQLTEIADVISSSSLENIEEILDEITNICFHQFKFARYHWELPSNSGFEVKVAPKGLDRAGNYFERFECQFYEEDGDQVAYVGRQECMVSLNILDHFIRIDPDVIDFGVCCFGSVYQEKFLVINTDTTPHRVLLQFPSSLKAYLSSSLAESVLSIGDKKEITLKFVPREDMVDDLLSFYDPETKILKFPIKAQVTTKGFPNIPPVKLTIYAILSESLGLILKPLNLDYASLNGSDILLDLGTCMTREAVVTKIGITNMSITRQHFGFLDLPMCLSIGPNYGFGVLQPYESKELILTFHPEQRDMEGCCLEGQQSILSFRISVTTLKQAGAIKKTFSYRRLRKLFQQVQDQLKDQSNNDLLKEIQDSVEILRNSDELIASKVCLTVDGVEYAVEMDGVDGAEADFKRPSPKAIKSHLPHILDNINSNKLWLLAAVVDLPFKLSHQYVVFPNTPCGSFSIMSVQLKTGGNTSNHHDDVDTEAHFKISGDNPQITMEPICGDIKSGKSSIDLYLIARPCVPDDVIEEKARYLKRLQIIEEKRKQILQKMEEEKQARLLQEKLEFERKQKLVQKKKNKDKKGKKTDETHEALENDPEPTISIRTEEDEPLPKITVKPAEVRINFFDLYPAEMVLWRDFEPKTIEANFTVQITYPNSKTPKKSDFLYLKAICKVVSPSFIHNLDRQHIDFGLTAIGSSKCQVLELRNIKDGQITPKTSYLSPVGCFTCPNLVDVSIPSEHVLKLPITFRPINTYKRTGAIAIIFHALPASDEFLFAVEQRAFELSARATAKHVMTFLEGFLWRTVFARSGGKTKALLESQGNVCMLLGSSVHGVLSPPMQIWHTRGSSMTLIG